MSFFDRIKYVVIPAKHGKKKKQYKPKRDSDSEPGKEYVYENGSMILNKCKNIHIGTALSYNLTSVYHNETINQMKTDGSETPSIPRDIEANFSRIDEPTVAQLNLVSENVKSDCNKLGLELGFSEEDLEDYSTDAENILILLLRWKQARTREATVGLLLKSLWNIGEYDAAKRLSDDIQLGSN